MVQAMSTFRILGTLGVLAAAGTAQAQEPLATPSFNSETDVTNAALQQKVIYLQQMVRMLEDKVRTCSANPNAVSLGVPSSSQPTTAEGDAPTETETAEPAPSYTTFRPASPAIRRPAVGYQVSAAAESRLTCEDYSRSYFSRHPAMAAVCKVNLEEPVTPPVAEVSPTLPVSASQVVSATVRPRLVTTTTR